MHNLIKTIARQKTVANAACGANGFEQRIRDILLAYTPNRYHNLDITTEHLLIKALKENGKKETNYNYNYRNKIDSDNEVEKSLVNVSSKKTCAPIEGDDLLAFLKNTLRVKKLDKDKCVWFMSVLRKYFDKWNKDDDDDSDGSVERLIARLKQRDKAYCDLDEHNIHLQQQLKELELVKHRYEQDLAAYKHANDEELQKTKLYAANIEESLKAESVNKIALRKNIDELTAIIESQQMTISVNTGDLLKLANEMGEKDHRIEELENENFQQIRNAARLEADAKDAYEQLQLYKTKCSELEKKNFDYVQLQNACANVDFLSRENENYKRLSDDMTKNVNILKIKCSQLEESCRLYKDKNEGTSYELEQCKLKLLDAHNELSRSKALCEDQSQKLTQYMDSTKRLLVENADLLKDLHSKDADLKKTYDEDSKVLEEHVIREIQLKKECDQLTKNLEKANTMLEKQKVYYEDLLGQKNEEYNLLINSVENLKEMVEAEVKKVNNDWEHKYNKEVSLLKEQLNKLELEKKDEENELDQVTKCVNLKEGELNVEKRLTNDLKKIVSSLQSQLSAAKSELEEKKKQVLSISKKSNFTGMFKYKDHEIGEPKRKVPKSKLAWNVNKLYNVSTAEELQDLIREIKTKNVNHKQWDTYSQFLTEQSYSDLKKNRDYDSLDDDFKLLLEKKHEIETQYVDEEASLFN